MITKAKRTVRRPAKKTLRTSARPRAVTPARRREDWVSRLSAFLAADGPLPFAWGQTDCCLFVCAAIAAMTGADPAAELRGSYSTEPEAKRIIARRGGFDALVETIAAAHGFQELANVASAGRGDMAIVDTPLGPALFLVDLTGRLLVGKTQPPQGRLPLRSARRAWRIS